MILLLLLASSAAFAADTSIGIGSQIGESAGSAQISYRNSIVDSTYIQLKSGYFDGLHFGIGGGLTIDLSTVEFRAGLSSGPTIGKSFLEFNGETYFGFKDRKNNRIGIQYDYLSSSIVGQNSRKYLTVQVGQEF